MPDIKRVVIVGGGIAGLEIATQLGHKLGRTGLADVTLVDRDSVHVWKPMLHMIAAGTAHLYPQQVSFFAHANQHGFKYCPGEVSGLNREAKTLTLLPLRERGGPTLLPARDIDYDVLIMAVGSHANDFGIEGVLQHCHFIDSTDQADRFQNTLRSQMFKVHAEDGELHIAIVGGGATGVELTASLIQLTDVIRNYGTSERAPRVKITLIESGGRLLQPFSEKVSRAVEAQLLALGVEIKTQKSVVAAREDAFYLLDGSELQANLKVWAAGVKAPNFLSSFGGLDTTSNNQLLVRPNLMTLKDGHIFAVGDCSSLLLPGTERALPPTAQIAHQQARHLIRFLPQYLQSGDLPEFEPRDYGSLISLGRYNAFGSLGKLGILSGVFLKGRAAQFSHAMLYRSHQARIHGVWRGSVLWLLDRIAASVHPKVRLD